MYIKDRPRALKPYTMASSLVPKSTKDHEDKIQIQPECLVAKKKKGSPVSYLNFLKDVEGSADGDRRDEVSLS